MADERFDKELDMEVDRAIALMCSNLSLFDDGWALGQLKRLLSELGYRGNNPAVMLKVFDVNPESEDALALGIRGFEESKRNPSVLVKLEHPEQLVNYTMATADSLDEIFELQETLLREGHIRRGWDEVGFSMSGYRTPDPKISLVSSIIMVADEIISRLNHVTEDYFKDLYNEKNDEKIREGLKQRGTKAEAYKSRVYAFQAVMKRKDFESPSDELEAALTAVQAYEEFTGAYTDDFFRKGLMEAYFRRKYSTTAPSTGEIPEELKAESNWMNSLYPRMNWDQFLRDIYFGRKEDPWKKRMEEATQEQARQSTEEARKRRNKHLEDWINDLMMDPWERHRSELDFLGINSEMSYQEAKARFWNGVKERRGTFIRQDVNTGGYKKANDDLAAYITAWRTVEPIYKIREAKEHAKTESTAAARPDIGPSSLGVSSD